MEKQSAGWSENCCRNEVDKPQTPSSNIQRNSKRQTLNQAARREFGAWDLEFLWSLELGYWSFSVLRVFYVEQPINHHASHGDIHPQRPCPARDFLVQFEALFPCAIQGHENHRHDDNRQQRVREQNGEVNGAKPMRVFKLGRAAMQNPGEVAVIGEVASQEKRGRDECRDHAIAMRGLVFAPDEDVASGQESCAQAVERSIEDGQMVDGQATERGQPCPEVEMISFRTRGQGCSRSGQ